MSSVMTMRARMRKEIAMLETDPPHGTRLSAPFLLLSTTR